MIIKVLLFTFKSETHYFCTISLLFSILRNGDIVVHSILVLKISKYHDIQPYNLVNGL